MLMAVLHLMRVQVLVNYPTMAVHMLMYQVCSQQKLKIIEHRLGASIYSDPMIFPHDYSSAADLLDDIQIMRCSYDSLSRLSKLLKEFY